MLGLHSTDHDGTRRGTMQKAAYGVLGSPLQVVPATGTCAGALTIALAPPDDFVERLHRRRTTPDAPLARRDRNATTAIVSCWVPPRRELGTVR
jgi:hypothetical protein